jgi:hypothetical protein
MPYSAESSNHALRYGESTEERLESEGPAGLLLISPLHPNVPASPATASRAKEHERYQRHILHEFTTRELKDIGSLVKDDAKNRNLTKLPLYFRKIDR